MAAGCGSGGAAATTPASEEICAFDGQAGTLQLESGSSHAHIWRDLTVDLATGRLTGRVSNVGPQITDVDETADVASLRALLEATCGAPSSAEAGPDDMGGGSTTLTVESPTHGRFVIVGVGLNHTLAAGTRTLEVSRDEHQRIVAAMPEPSAAP